MKDSWVVHTLFASAGSKLHNFRSLALNLWYGTILNIILSSPCLQLRNRKSFHSLLHTGGGAGGNLILVFFGGGGGGGGN